MTVRRLIVLAAALLVGGGALGPAAAADKLHVVATIPDLKALTEAVGGNLVDVVSLTRGMQNAHEAEIRPTMMLKLRRADALIENGLDLDSWVEVAVQGANNPNIVRGSAGRVDISRGMPVLEVPTTRVDRGSGDVHPLGNLHFSLDPGLAPAITQNIVDRLAHVAPAHRVTFERNRRVFLDQLDAAMAEWTKVLEPFRGAEVVVYHPQWIDFLTRFGLVQAATLEDRPGIPPSPGHVARVIPADEGRAHQGDPRRAVERPEVRRARGRRGWREGDRAGRDGWRRPRYRHLSGRHRPQRTGTRQCAAVGG